jgi:hypothetical protein
VSGAGEATEQRWTFGVRAIQGQIDRATLRSTLTCRVAPRFSLGLEYNPLVDSVSPLANWLAVTETDRRPALIFGTSSDRIGTPEGQSFYGTASKSLRRETRLPIAPYVGVAFGTFEDEWRPIGGLNIGFTEELTALLIHDGVNFHPTFSRSRGRHVVTLLLVDGYHPGISYSISFAGPERWLARVAR